MESDNEKQSMKIVFDVGANDGHSCAHLAGPDCQVYAFEPTPQLVSVLRNRYGSNTNYHIIDAAVGDYNGQANFNVAGQHDWGCSSIMNFSDSLDKTWPNRSDFKVTEVIKVPVIRLDKFIQENNITRIDYLHIDTQGFDLFVMIGLGIYTSIVQKGVLEVPREKELRLYKEQPSKEDVIEFLNKNGFKVDLIEDQENEQNIFFSRA